MNSEHHPDTRSEVIVIGAGIAGLNAARTLARAGVDVVVLEARDRVGGRTFNLGEHDGDAIEAGGMWIYPGQTAVTDLAAELGIDTFLNPVGGDLTLRQEGARSVVSADLPTEAEAVVARIDDLAQRVSPAAPWEAFDAVELDSLTLAEWLHREQVPAPVAARVVGLVAIAFGDPAGMSMLWFLHIVAAAGGMHHIGDITDGAQERRLRGGTYALSAGVAAELGDRVVTASPVVSVRLHDDGVTVTTESAVWQASSLIIAMMPSDVDAITFDPPLPADRVELQQRWKGRPGIKAFAIYERPFWRDQGLSGMAIADARPITDVLDCTPPNQQGGWLVAFVDPDQVADRDDVSPEVTSTLAALFGDEALAPVAFYSYDWSADPWSGGCVTELPTGLLTAVGTALRTPVGPIHWAGAETAEQWVGYIDGAIRSGHRAAAEVLDRLGPT